MLAKYWARMQVHGRRGLAAVHNMPRAMVPSRCHSLVVLVSKSLDTVLELAGLSNVGIIATLLDCFFRRYC